MNRLNYCLSKYVGYSIFSLRCRNTLPAGSDECPVTSLNPQYIFPAKFVVDFENSVLIHGDLAGQLAHAWHSIAFFEYTGGDLILYLVNNLLIYRHR